MGVNSAKTRSCQEYGGQEYDDHNQQTSFRPGEMLNPRKLDRGRSLCAEKIDIHVDEIDKTAPQ
jgi:hypothetical protein